MKQLALLVMAVGLFGVSCSGSTDREKDASSSGGVAVPDMASPDMTALDTVAPKAGSVAGPMSNQATIHERSGGEENVAPEVRHKKHHDKRQGKCRTDESCAAMIPCDENCDLCQQCLKQSLREDETQGNTNNDINADTDANLGRQPQSENTQTTDKEKLGITEAQAPAVCNNSPHAHAPFLRSDLAYSVTGVDCSGDLPQPLGETPKIVGRGIASTRLNCGPHDHPMFLRSDLSYGITGQDCSGDPVTSK